MDFNNIFIGSMLGDGCITKRGRFSIKQKLANKEYLEYLSDGFDAKVYVYYKYKPKRIGKKIISTNRKSAYCAFSKQTPFISNMREKWYPNGNKIIPQDLILNEEILSHWHFQDGYNCQRNRNVVLNTNGFKEKDVDFLIYRLKEDLEINASKNYQRNQPIIQILSNFYFDFVSKCKKYCLCKCMKYKVDTSKAQYKNPNIKRKLNKNKVKEIRLKYSTGNYTQVALSKEFGVSRSTIREIVNFETWKSVS